MYSFVAIIYPIFVSLILINVNDSLVVNLSNHYWTFNFSYENKLLGYAFVIVTLVANLYAISQNRKFEVIAGSLYCFASLVCVFTEDFILMFIALELMMVCATLLIFIGRYADSVKAAKQYFLTHLISGMFILIGISYIITQNSDAHITSLTTLIEQKDNAFIFYIFILCGCLINVGSLPFSGWIVNCYPAASTSGMLYLTSFTSKVSIMILLKLFSGLEILKFLGLLMIIYGGFYACIEDNIRRISCYLTVSQLGFMITAIGTNSYQVQVGMVVFLFVHILYKALFNLYIAILVDKAKIENCSEVTAIYSIRNPLLFFALILSVALIISMPPLASYTTKMVITNSFDNNSINYYGITLLKIITCAAIFSMVRYKALTSSFYSRLNIGAKISLILMIGVTFVVSFFLESIILLVWPSYPTNMLDTNWSSVLKQMVLIFIGLLLAVLLSKTVTRFSTVKANLDFFRFMKGNLSRLYFKYKYRLMGQEFSDTSGDYNFLNLINRQVINNVKILDNQSTALFIVLMLLSILTLLLI